MQGKLARIRPSRQLHRNSCSVAPRIRVVSLSAEKRSLPKRFLEILENIARSTTTPKQALLILKLK